MALQSTYRRVPVFDTLICHVFAPGESQGKDFGFDCSDNVDDTASLLRAGWPGFDSRQGNIFLLSTVSRPAPGSTQPPVQWVPGLFSPEVKRSEREADCIHVSSAEVKNSEAILPFAHIFMA
jgi:hypothetical protein